MTPRTPSHVQPTTSFDRPDTQTHLLSGFARYLTSTASTNTGTCAKLSTYCCIVFAIRVLGESSTTPEPFHSHHLFACSSTPFAHRQQSDSSPAVQFRNQQEQRIENGWRLLPLGARVAANIMSRNTSSGIGSSRYRRIARVVLMPSSNPTMSGATGVFLSTIVQINDDQGRLRPLPISSACDHDQHLHQSRHQLFRQPTVPLAILLPTVHQTVH